jgi:hypothetical protein
MHSCFQDDETCDKDDSWPLSFLEISSIPNFLNSHGKPANFEANKWGPFKIPQNRYF